MIDPLTDLPIWMLSRAMAGYASGKLFRWFRTTTVFG